MLRVTVALITVFLVAQNKAADTYSSTKECRPGHPADPYCDDFRSGFYCSKLMEPCSISMDCCFTDNSNHNVVSECIHGLCREYMVQ